MDERFRSFRRARGVAAVPRKNPFDGQLRPVLITGGLVLIVVAAIAAPRLRGTPPENAVVGAPEAPRSEGAPGRPQVFRYYSERPSTLDPALASDAYSSIVIAQIFSPLVGLTSDLEPIPQIAQSWTISRDGLVYIFHIHPGVRFHNGREVEAKDFVYSLTRLFKEPYRSQGLAAGYLDAIVGVPEFVSGRARTIRGIFAIDRYRLEIRLVRPYGALLSALALDQASVVPRECVESSKVSFARHPVGCGPFRITARGNDERLVLASNARYFQGKPAIDSIVFYTPKGTVDGVDTDGARALLHGDAAMANLPLNMLDELHGHSSIRVVRWQDLSLSFIGMNVTVPPLRDVRVRKAIAMAMGREEMLALWPAGKVLSQGIVPPGLPGYSPERRAYEHDTAEARRLLASAGYGPGHPLPSMTLWKATANQSVRDVDSLMVKTLAEAGIQVRLKYVSWTELDRAITARRVPLFGLAWIADIPDPDTFLRSLFYSRSGTNYFGFADRAVDSLLDVAQRTADPQIRMDAYRSVETRVVRAAPLVPLFHSSTFVGLREEVSGLEVNPLGISTLAMEKLRIGTPLDKRDRQASR